jgi:hypothetical protein
MKITAINFDKYDYSKLLKYLLWVFLIVTIADSIQKLSLGEKIFWGHNQTYYNNYVIFKTSFKHLIDGVNLYDQYVDEYGDYYKYSPTFAVLMAPFYFLPDWIGLIVWDVLNCLLLYYGVLKLPQLTLRIKFFILSFSFIEMMTSLQNSQSNAMIAGLILLAFISLEKNKIPLATFLIMICFYIKLTGILACILFLFYDKKWKFISWSAFWFVLMAALPLLFTDLQTLITQYKNWGVLLADDHSQSYGISVFGIINSWFSIEPSKTILLLTGVVLFLLPLIRIKRYTEYNFRLLYVCSLLIWIVIFNHKAESPSFVVAIVGCAIWYFNGMKNNVNLFLICLAFVLISLSPTDLFPKIVRTSFIIPYALKALPAVLIWIVITYELLRKDPSKRPVPSEHL